MFCSFLWSFCVLSLLSLSLCQHFPCNIETSLVRDSEDWPLSLIQAQDISSTTARCVPYCTVSELDNRVIATLSGNWNAVHVFVGESLYTNIGAGMLSGAIGSAIANPTDVLKVTSTWCVL